MKICYTTICDVNYIAPALALYASLRDVSDHAFRFYTLDDDAAVHLSGLKLPGAGVFAPGDYIPEPVAALRSTRSEGAFAFTVKPVALLHAMQAGPEFEWVGHLDVDMWAFADPGKILTSLDDLKTVSLTPHRFTASFRKYESTAGRFNAGYAAFRSTDSGKAILQHWRALCIEWCHDYVAGERYGDQKYLEVLADTYSAVDVCRHKGANTAPWNVSPEMLSTRGGAIYIDDDPLLFYHFQGLKLYGPRLATLYAGSELMVDGRLRELVYLPYVNALFAANRQLELETAWVPRYVRRAPKTKLKALVNRMLGKPHNFYRHHTDSRCGVLPDGGGNTLPMVEKTRRSDAQP